MLGEEYDSESKQLLEELLKAPKRGTTQRVTQRTRQRPLEPKSAKGFGKGMAMDLEPLTKVPEKAKTKSRKLLEEGMDKPTLLAKRFQAGGEARSNPMLEQAEMTLLLAKTGEPSISFGAAFQAARALGRETFDWRGKPYRAQTAEEARGRPSLPRGMKESDLYRDPAQERINKEYYDATQAIEKDYQQSLRDISSESDTRQKRDLQPYTSDMVPFERNQEALRELDRHMAGLRKYEEDELIQGTVNEEVQKAVEQDRAEMDRLGKEIAFYESLLRLKNYEDAERDADAQVNAQRLKGMEREQAVQPVYPELLLPGLPKAVRGAAAMLDRLRGGKPRSKERKEPTMNFQKGGEARQDENFSARAQLDSFRIPVEPRVGLPPMEDDYTRSVNYFERMTPEQQRYINEKSRLVQSVRGGVPDFETRNTTSAYGAEMGPYGKVFMGQEAKNLQRSLAHEMTHAVDDSLERLYEHARKNPDTPLAKQFVALYKNLGEQTRPDDAKRLSPEWYKSMQTAEDPKDAEWGRYRTSPKELGAWAAGIMFSPENLRETVKGGTKPTRGGLHVDPTLTTQLEILKEFGAKYADELMRQSAHEMYVPPYVAPPQAASVAPKKPTRSKKSSSRVRPIKRAEGGDVSRETLDARSYLDELNARDDPIRSGKPLQSRTRKKATPEENEALNRAVLQGAANMPYNMAGAPVDLLNMLLTPAGLGSKQPVMGSDWIKQKMTDLGVRPEPPTDPTQRALYSAADLGSSLVNPAAPVRAAVKGAEKTGEAARMLAEDFQRYNQALGPAGASQLTTWHGSPYAFKNFDPAKIGTGEGRQAYSQGYYSAEARPVAEGYQRDISRKKIVQEFRKELPDDASFEEALEAAENMSPPAANLIRALSADDWLGFDYPSQAISAALRDLNNFEPSDALRKAVQDAQGYMYKIDIPDEAVAKMLDWDKPLGQQSQTIQDIGKGLGLSMDDLGGDLIAAAGAKTRAGAERLRQAGIPGVRYLDAQSRGGKKLETQNFVVFPGNEDLMRILERNDQPIEGLAKGGLVNASTAKAQLAKLKAA